MVPGLAVGQVIHTADGSGSDTAPKVMLLQRGRCVWGGRLLTGCSWAGGTLSF